VGSAADYSHRRPLIDPKFNKTVKQKRALAVIQSAISKFKKTKLDNHHNNNNNNNKPRAVSKSLNKSRSSKRVQTKSTKPNAFSIKLEYQHSVNTGRTESRKQIQRKFLQHSIESIKNVCALNDIKLSSQSLKSLVDSEGQYVTYINPIVVSKVSTQLLQLGVINEEAFNNTLISAAASKISMHGSNRFRAYVSPSTAHN
jgi:hypothetical protein